MNTQNKKAALREQILALFALSFIRVLGVWELPNDYWPEHADYAEVRNNSPWFLVKTNKGLIKIGWRKRVLSIDWSDTSIRTIVTEEKVTKNESLVHAWDYRKALEYLTVLSPLFKEPDVVKLKGMTVEEVARIPIVAEWMSVKGLGEIQEDHVSIRYIEWLEFQLNDLLIQGV